ncbi:MAG: SDR family NAD(P)-dependent oxidoreductase, partial [Allobaculum sp.]|nr:SDR family NAD(P)-dependent oxidoreductase [Allobaculum sp.]
MTTFDFTGKTIIVAGAGGIGAEIAKILSNAGSRIILLDISEKGLDSLLLDINSGVGYHCDFSDISSIEPLVKKIVTENGPIDDLVYAAGIGEVRPVKLCK